MKKIAIDLLWLRPGKVGGTEFYVRNLLDGFLLMTEPFDFVLLTSKDNQDTFGKYLLDKRFSKMTVNVESANIKKRIIWQVFQQNLFLRKHHIRYCFSPVYCRPFFNGGITYYTTIPDIQAYHYPQYHPGYETVYSKLCWLTDKHKNKHTFAISDFVRQDLINVYHFNPNKITTIYIGIDLDISEEVKFECISDKYGIAEKEYFYTICQMIPHKNIITLVKMLSEIKARDIKLPRKLVVSGISGNASDDFLKAIDKYGLQKEIILTGFVSNGEKISLYRHCADFLFPSIFEGFGMPPLEAMMCGATVVTTRCASIPEVTQEKANYVSNPFDINDWIDRISNAVNRDDEIDWEVFNKKKLAEKYYQYICD